MIAAYRVATPEADIRQDESRPLTPSGEPSGPGTGTTCASPGWSARSGVAHPASARRFTGPYLSTSEKATRDDADDCPEPGRGDAFSSAARLWPAARRIRAVEEGPREPRVARDDREEM